jgi:hypothetical protein
MAAASTTAIALQASGLGPTPSADARAGVRFHAPAPNPIYQNEAENANFGVRHWDRNLLRALGERPGSSPVFYGIRAWSTGPDGESSVIELHIAKEITSTLDLSRLSAPRL